MAADLRNTVEPTLGLLEACRDAGVRKLIFVSSGGTVYGNLSSRRISEDSITNPISAYGVSKLATEKYIQLYKTLHGLDCAILRVANPYGPYQNLSRPQGFVGSVMAKAMAGEPVEIWGDGDVVRDFIFVRDVAEAIVTAARYEGNRTVFNVGSGLGRTLNEVISDILNVIAVDPVEIRYLSPRVADVRSNILDVDLIHREMGWTPKTEWIAGLTMTHTWLRSVAGGALPHELD